MKKPVMALVASGALALATVSATKPAHAIDPWTAAAWFVGGLFVGGAIVGPAYGYGYGYGAPYAYAPAYAGWAPERCYATKIKQGGVWYPARVCY
jgi:hypothetical protein